MPRGDGELTGPIPMSGPHRAYQLPDALGDLATTIDQPDTDQLSQSLDTLAQTFAEHPTGRASRRQGLSRFSNRSTDRDAQLRNLLSNANKATRVLAERSDQSGHLDQSDQRACWPSSVGKRCAGPVLGKYIGSCQTAVGVRRRKSRAIQAVGGQAQRRADHRRQPQGRGCRTRSSG